MLKKAKFSVAVILCLVLLCSCSGRKAKNAGYLVYRSSPVGVEIEYPDFWEMNDDKKDRTVAFAAPMEGYADQYRDNVSVCSYEIDKNDDLAFDKFVTDYIDKLPSTIAGYTLVSEGNYPIESYPDSYRIVYEGTAGEDGTLRLQQTFINSGGYAYVYSFIAQPQSYDYFNRNSEIMLSTFKALRK